MNVTTSSSSSGPNWYWTGSNANGFTQTLYLTSPGVNTVTLPGDDLIRLPEHEFNPTERTGKYCQDCPPGSIFVDEPGKHLYVIREWEIG